MLKNLSLNQVVVLLTSIGFIGLLVDTTIEHIEIFQKEILVFLPAVFCLLISIFGIIVVFKWKKNLINIFRALLFSAFIISAVGFIVHLEDDEDENEKIKSEQYEEHEKDKPLLAPFAFAGLAMFGLTATCKKWSTE